MAGCVEGFAGFTALGVDRGWVTPNATVVRQRGLEHARSSGVVAAVEVDAPG
jgi:hypothetical protein